MNDENKLYESINWNALSKAAWDCRENAFVYGKTKVGAAVFSTNQKIYSGCNVEHIFRSHDVHAEVNAIGTMIACGCQRIAAILIAAERELFTPCGSCMDWIMQFGGSGCIVAFQSEKNGKINSFRAEELMPHYPIY